MKKKFLFNALILKIKKTMKKIHKALITSAFLAWLRFQVFLKTPKKKDSCRENLRMKSVVMKE